MPDNFQSPLRGFPTTTGCLDKNGRPSFIIRVNELTPRRAKVRDDVNMAIRGFLVLLGIYVALCTNGNDTAIATYAALAMLAYWISSGTVTAFLKKETRLEINADAVRLPGFIEPRNYARNMEHSFQLLAHDGAQEEQLRHDLDVREASTRGQVIQKKAYFAQSCHVVLVYGGHRIDIAEVYGLKEAGAIINRLIYCDRVIDQALNMGGGVRPDPKDDWPSGGPGGLGGFGHV